MISAARSARLFGTELLAMVVILGDAVRLSDPKQTGRKGSAIAGSSSHWAYDHLGPRAGPITDVQPGLTACSAPHPFDYALPTMLYLLISIDPKEPS
jgi:hypothetical protein